MTQLVQYILVILVLLGAIGLFMAVSLNKSKRNQKKEGCDEDVSGCSTCLEDCGLKREILEKSKSKHLRQSK
jgi:hypothetical protein